MATEVLRPNAAGAETTIEAQYPDSTYHWDKVDEAGDPDGPATCVIQYLASWGRDLYNLPASSGSGTINKITLYFNVMSSLTGLLVRGAIKSNTTVTETANKDPYVDFGPAQWGTYSNIWTTNPAPPGTNAWTWDDIDALQIGIALFGSGGGDYIKCTQVYVEVDYTAGVPYEKTLTESLGLVDKVVKAPSLVKTEPLGLLDTYSRTWAAHQTYSELLGLADIVSKGVVQHPLTEALGLSDTVVKEPGKVLNESLGLLDVYSRTWSVYRTYTELLGLLDTITKDVSLPLSEILGLLDTYNRVWSVQRTYTEALGLEDRVSKHPSKALVEVLGLLDSVAYSKNPTVLAKLIRKFIQLESIGGGGVR